MNVDEIAAAVLAGAEKLIAKAVEPLQAQIKELEEARNEWRTPFPVNMVIDGVTSKLLSGDAIKTLIDLEFSAYMAANPVKDGVGLAGAMIDRDNCLLVTLTNGEVKNLGPVVGKDGMGFDDLTVEHDGEGAVTLKFSRGGIVKEFPLRFAIPTYKGYYREGAKAEAGQIFTHKGNAWIAIKDTASEPQRERKDEWQIFAAKGNDGRDGKDLLPRPETIKL